MTKTARPVTIYGLKTANSRVLYVGQTMYRPSSRLNRHWAAALNNGPWPISTWLRSLERDAVEIVELEIGVSPELSAEREEYWIDELKTLTADGGLNVRKGYAWTGSRKPATKWVKNDLTDEERRRQKSRRVSEGARRSYAENPERLDQLSASLKEHYQQPEARARMSKQSRDNWADPEYKERLRATHRARLATPEGKAAMERGVHTRWHVGRGISKPTCQLCASEATEPGA